MIRVRNSVGENLILEEYVSGALPDKGAVLSNVVFLSCKGLDFHAYFSMYDSFNSEGFVSIFIQLRHFFFFLGCIVR